jgi:hypothetical protein
LAEQGQQSSGPSAIELRFAGDTDGALATAIMQLVRTGQLQLAQSA